MSFITTRAVLTIIAALTTAGCESPGASRPDDDGPAVTVAAMSLEGSRADTMEMTISVPLPPSRAGAAWRGDDSGATPIIGATVRVIDATFGVVLDTLQFRYGSGEVGATLELVLPRAYDELAVTLDIETHDARGDSLSFRQDLPKGAARSMTSLERGPVEATVLSREELAQPRADAKPGVEATP